MAWIKKKKKTLFLSSSTYPRRSTRWIIKYFWINFSIMDALQWFSSYLSDRFQFVEMDGFRSDMLNITTGVPQGSILGPLLFIIYVNDMHSISDQSNFIAYADDTTLTSPLLTFTRGVNCNIDTISSEMNKEIKKITDWLAVNKLSLNASKTKFMVFHYYQEVIADKDVPQLKIGNIDIERVKEFNFLGLSINENLTWSSHAKKISNKISRIIGIMNRLKRFLPLSALKLMYFSLINSHLQFCVATWGFDHSRINKLQKRQLEWCVMPATMPIQIHFSRRTNS